MSVSSVKAGEAFVEAYLENSKLIRGLQSTEGMLKAWGSRISSAGAGTLGVGLGITAPLAAAVGVFSEMGGNLEDMSARTGISVGALTELGFAAEQTGASMETVEGSIKKMQKTIAEAFDGNKQSMLSLSELGVSLDELKGKSPDQQFARIASAVAKIQDPAKRTQAALSIFGKSGTQLIPLMQNFDDLAARARELGLTLSSEDTAAADAFGDSLDELWSVGKVAAFTIGASLAPSLQSLVTWLAESSAGAVRWVNENRGLVTIAAGAGVALVGLGGGLLFVGTSMKLMAPALGLVRVGVTGVVTAATMIGPAFMASLAVLASPLGLTLAAVTALGIGFYTMTDSGKQAAADLGTAFGTLKADAITTFDGIKAAMQAGDFQLAAEILWAGLQVAWASGTATIQGIWADVVEVMQVAWNNAVAYIGGIWDSLLSKLQSGRSALIGFTYEVAEAAGVVPQGAAGMVKVGLGVADNQFENELKDKAAKRDKALQDANRKAFSDNDAKRRQAEQGLADKRAELERLRQKAVDQAAGKVPDFKNRKGDDGPDLESVAQKLGVKGTFNAAIVGQLAGENQTTKELKEAKKIHEKQLGAMERVVRKLENTPGLAFAP